MIIIDTHTHISECVYIYMRVCIKPSNDPERRYTGFPGGSGELIPGAKVAALLT